MKRVGRVDVAIVALANIYLNTLAAQKALEYVRAYRPGVFMPAHHDAPYNDLWRTTEPIFQVMKDENPGLITDLEGLSGTSVFQDRQPHRCDAVTSRGA